MTGRSTPPHYSAPVDACVKAGGGVVLVPPGRYLTGTLFLGNNLELHLCAGATLVASQRFDDFPPIDGRYEGIERKIHAALLTGERLGNVSITGGGSIDGQGAPWWQAFEVTQKMRIARGLAREAPNPAGAPLRYPCPSIINLIRCERVRIEGIAFENSPLWNVNLVYCQDAVVDSVSMVGLHSPMSCGVYIDSCKRVRVTGSAIASGSDCIASRPATTRTAAASAYRARTSSSVTAICTTRSPAAWPSAARRPPASRTSPSATA
jgi:polygalacturonase